MGQGLPLHPNSAIFVRQVRCNEHVARKCTREKSCWHVPPVLNFVASSAGQEPHGCRPRAGDGPY